VTLADDVRALHAEVDCRIGHGAESGGHLEYVRTRLAAMRDELDNAGAVAECDRGADGVAHGY
jgi:hypothetical protein